jgi:multidrug transporter EmrE-like cation transporter
MALVLYTVVYAVLATTGLIVLRSSLEDATIAEGLRMPGVYLGAVCYAASFGTFMLSLRRFDVLTVFPVFSGVAYASVALAAAAVLGEDLGTARVLGLGLVGVGVILLTR